jgi:hypothetical protein
MGTMDAVNATDAVGVAEAADERDHLLARGLSEAQAERLIALKRRQAQRRPDGLSEKRLQFVRWLVAQHRLHEGAPPGPSGPAASVSND